MTSFFRALPIFFLAFVCGSTTAQAAPVKIDFSGEFDQLTASCSICGPYNATLTFDTANGEFQQAGPGALYFSMIEPAYFTIEFSNIGFLYGDGFLHYTPNSLLSANIGWGFSHLSYNAGTINYVQAGTCGSYCAYIGIESFTVSGVPGPIVGAGLPSLLIAAAGLIGWHRSRRAISRRKDWHGETELHN